MATVNIVKGNPCPLSITLRRQSIEVTSEGAERVVKDFFPGSGAPVKVLLQCGAYRQQQIAAMSGNIAVVRFDETLDTGLYGIEVLCQDSDGQPCRWKRAEAVEVHDESIGAGLAEDVEFDDTPYHLGTAIFPGVVIADTGGGGGYVKPDGGIQKEDLSEEVQTSLGKADSALQQTDKTELQNAINSLQSALNTLIGSGNVQGAIDTFNEVTAFLNGIDTSDPALANQLLALNNAISAVQTSLAAKANSADVYSKSEVDGKVADAGKVKSVTINGTTKTPNETTGDVDLGTIVCQQGPAGPQGNSGVASADGVIVVNNLTEGGTDVEVDGVTKVKVLSAEMGKELNEMKAEITDNDKVVLNSQLFDFIGEKDVDYWVIEDTSMSNWNGNIISKNDYQLVLVKVRRNTLSYRGLTVNGYRGFWTTDIQPSLEDVSVDLNGDPIEYTKGNTNQGTRKNLNITAKYVLIDAQESGNNIEISFANDFIEINEEYDVVSINDGKRFRANSLSGVTNATMDYLKSGLAERINQIDKYAYLSGVRVSQTSSPKVQITNGYKMLCQKIPSDATNVLVMGHRSSSAYSYMPVVLLDNDFNIVSASNKYGTSALTSFFDEIPDEAKYVAVNIEGTDVPFNVDDLLLVFNLDIRQGANYREELYSKRNENKFLLDYEFENFPVNQLNIDNLVSSSVNNGTVFILEFPVRENEKFIFWSFVESSYNNSEDNFIQYDEEGNVLKKTSPAQATSLYYTSDKSSVALVRLENGCRKVRFKAMLGLRKLTVNQSVESGDKIYLLPNRIVPKRSPRIESINGIKLGITDRRPLEGLTICCFGDSITDFGSSSSVGGYPDKIQLEYDCAVYNYGRGNAHFIDNNNTDPTSNTDPGTANTYTPAGSNNMVSTQVRWCLREMEEEGVTPDVAIIGGGTNDCFYNVSYGDLSSSLGSFPNTADVKQLNFYDCVCYFVSKLQAAFPKIKIYLSTPIRSLSLEHNANVTTWCEHVFEVANALGLDVIDFNGKSGIIEYPAATVVDGSYTHNNPWFNSDEGLHPSDLGVQAMERLVVSRLTSDFPK